MAIYAFIISCVFIALFGSAVDARVVATHDGYRAFQPSPSIQARMRQKIDLQKHYDEVEKELIDKHTPPPPSPLTKEDVEAIVEGKSTKNPAPPEVKIPESEPNPFGPVGGLGTVGGIGAVGAVSAGTIAE